MSEKNDIHKGETSSTESGVPGQRGMKLDRGDKGKENAMFVARTLVRDIGEALLLVRRFTDAMGSPVSNIKATEVLSRLGTLVTNIDRWGGEYDKDDLGKHLERSGIPAGLKARVERLRAEYQTEVLGRLEVIKQQILDRAIE